MLVIPVDSAWAAHISENFGLVNPYEPDSGRDAVEEAPPKRYRKKPRDPTKQLFNMRATYATCLDVSLQYANLDCQEKEAEHPRD